jgi:HSP20 family protein
MNNLTRWDPMREMFTMRDAMDKLFESFFDSQSSRTTAGWYLPMDVVEDENGYVVKASIPGISPEDLDITFTNRNLVIKGEVKSDENIEDARYHLRERRYGRFERSLYLPTEVDQDQIEASYEAGVLTLRLPKTEEVKPKRIAVKSGNGRKVLESSFRK